MVPTHAPKPLIWLLAAAVACFISIACATEKGSEQQESEPAQKSEEVAEPAEQEVKVYTTEDLDKLFGEGDGAVQTVLPPVATPEEPREPVMEMKVVEPEPAEKSATDALRRLQQQQVRIEERNRTAAEAERAAADARERVKQLEQRILALKNPYMARPKIPDEEKSDWDAMGTRERIAKSEEALQQAREDLKAAEKALAEIR